MIGEEFRAGPNGLGRGSELFLQTSASVRIVAGSFASPT
jgi:hypothetical protein